MPSSGVRKKTTKKTKILKPQKATKKRKWSENIPQNKTDSATTKLKRNLD